MSVDLVTWRVGSEALLPAMQPPSPLASSAVVYFSPFVVYNRATGMFVMWFQMYAAALARLPFFPITYSLPFCRALSPCISASSDHSFMYFKARGVAVSSSPLGPFPKPHVLYPNLNVAPRPLHHRGHAR